MIYITMYLEVRGEPLHDAFPTSIQLQVKSNLFNGTKRNPPSRIHIGVVIVFFIVNKL